MNARSGSRVLVWISLLVFPSVGRSQTNLVWDPNGASAGYGGNGNWTAAGEWFNPATPGYQNWSGGANAGFGGTAGNVTLNSTITAAGLGFDVGGYTITGTGTITLNHPTGDEQISANAGTTIMDVILGGTSGFRKTGAGTVVLQKANTVTGTIMVSEGTLRLSGGTAVADNADVFITASVSGSSLDLNSTNETIGSLAGTGGTLALGTGVLTTGGNNSGTTFSGTVSGNGGVVKAGTGGFTLNGTGGTRSYDITVNDGWVTLAHGDTATCDANASIVINGPGSLNINSDLILDNTTLTRAAGATLSILSGKTLTVQNGGDIAIVGSHFQSDGTMTVQGGGSTFTQIGSGNLSLGMTSGTPAAWNIFNGAACDTGSGTFTIDRTGAVDFTTGSLNVHGDLVVAGTLKRTSTGAFTQTEGETLTIQGGGQVLFTNEQTFGNDLTISGSGSLLKLSTGSSNGGLYFDGTIETPLGGRTVNVSAGGKIVTELPAWIGHEGTTSSTLVKVNIDGVGSSFDASAARTYISNGVNSGELIFSNGATGKLGSLLSLSEGFVGARLSVRSGADVTAGFIDAIGYDPLIVVSGGGSVLRCNNFNLGVRWGSRAADIHIRDGGCLISGADPGAVSTVDADGRLSIVTGGRYENGQSLTLDGGRLECDATGIFTLPAGKTLNIRNNGDADFAGSWYLQTPALVNVSDNGSTLTGAGALAFAGGSALNVTNGGSVNSASELWIGTMASGGGTATVDGAGSSISATATSYVGWSGKTGSLTVRNGATGSLGRLIVAGDATAGSTGTVVVESGTQITTSHIEAATGAAATSGTITVTGGGATLTQTGTSTLTLGADSGSTATLNVNSGGVFHGGTGTITVNKTGVITTSNGVFNANGDIVIDGGRLTRLLGTFNLAPGRSLTAQNGGLIEFMGAGQSLANTISLSGPGSALNSNSSFTTSGTMTVAAGAAVDVSCIDMTGSVTVTGAGSSLVTGNHSPSSLRANTAANLTFANNATGTIGMELLISDDTGLHVQSGADVLINGLVISPNPIPTGGTATVTGAGSTLTLGFANIGWWGGTHPASVHVTDGGVLNGTPGTIEVGASGLLSIAGGIFNANAVDVKGGRLTRDATGVFNLAAGKTLAITSGGDADFAGSWQLESPATVSVSGSGSTLTATTVLAFAGGSVLNVTNGGAVTSGSELWIGTMASGGGTATVDGAGSSISASATTFVGWSGKTGSLALRNGATGSLGRLVVAGDGTAGSTGTVVIESGAQVTTGNIEQATATAATSGIITVTGTGSKLTQTAPSNLILGATSGSAAALNVNSGGVFDFGGMFQGVTGTASIRSTGTLAVNDGTARLGGVNHYGTIQLTNAALVEVRGTCFNHGNITTDATSTVHFLGLLAGTGAFNGPGTIRCDDKLDPDPAAATTSFGGKLTMGGSLTTIMHLGGTQRGTQYDAIDVSGQLTAGGYLVVNLINGFQPKAGDAFDLFNWGSITGGFGSYSLPALGPDLEWDISRILTTGGLIVVYTPHVAWRLTHFGTTSNSGDAADSADPDKDGVLNLLEYAFGLHPLQSDAHLVPRWQRAGDTLVCSFIQPDGVSDVVYGAEWSSTLAPGSWNPLIDTGMPPQHIFTLPMNSGPRLFGRLVVVTSAPTPP